MARLLLLRALRLGSILTIFLAFSAASLSAQADKLMPLPRTPDPNASATLLEQQGDLLRLQKRYLDSLDFYGAAIAKQPSALLWNKQGMSYILLQRFSEASKCFDEAIKLDKHAPAGYNNRGYIEQHKGNYNKAIKYYKKALSLQPNDAVFHYNMGSSYFGKHDYVRASQEYRAAYVIDPGIFDRVSHSGIMAQSSSPEDRAAFYFMLARLYAQGGDIDRSLEYLRKALEEGYKDIKKVYTDSEFATLRTDKRFSQLMAQKPQAIQ